jgi:hypothetical protein
MTLDLSASNYALSATDITIGIRGILNGRGSTITCSGSWDSSAGTYTVGTSILIMTGASKTLKLGSESLYKLQVNTGATITASSNLPVTYSETITGTLTLGSYTNTISGSQASCFNAHGGTWTGTVTITSSASPLSLAWDVTATGYVAFSNPATITLGSTGLVQFVPTATVTIAAVTDAHTTTTIGANAYSFTLSGSGSDAILAQHLTSGAKYQVAVDTVPVSTIGCLAGYVNYTYAGPWTTHTVNFVLNQGYTAPSFSSSPKLNATANHTYSYGPTVHNPSNYSLSWYLVTNATGVTINQFTGLVQGSINASGTPYLHVEVKDGISSVWQNYTLTVAGTAGQLSDTQIFTIILALVFGFGFTFIGLRRKEFWILAGPVWIISGLEIFLPYGTVFLLASVGFGMALFMMGVYDAVT